MEITAAKLAMLLGPGRDSGPAYRDIAERIHTLVVDGRLPNGTRLPSERTLTEPLDVSRTTVTRAYAELRDMGLVRSRRGAGSVVTVPFAQANTSSMITAPDDASSLAMTYAAAQAPPGLGSVYAAALDQLPGLLSTSGYLPDGLLRLREALADRYTARGLPTAADQIIVTNGALGAISLTARAVLSRGDRVIVEPLGFPHAYEALTAAGGRLAPMPNGRRPWDVEAAEQLARAGARAAYLCPDFHNPTGETMDDEERSRIGRAFRRAGVVPIIDETLREINLDGLEMPGEFARHAPGALLIGSASKTYWGGLRIGWIRAPQAMAMTLIQSRMSTDLGTAAFEQLVLAELLHGDGSVEAAGRARLRAQRDVLMEALASRLPSWEVNRPAGGMTVWARLPEARSSALVAAARAYDMVLTPGPRFYAQAGMVGERWIRLPFTHTPERLVDAVDRLALAWAAGTSSHDLPEFPLSVTF